MAGRRRRSAAFALLATGTWITASANFLLADREWAIELPSRDFGSMDLSSSTSTVTTSAPSNRKKEPQLPLPPRSRPKRRRGRITFELKGTSFSVGSTETAVSESQNVTQDSATEEQMPSGKSHRPSEQVTFSADPLSTIRLLRLLAMGSISFSAAFMGTLRLLAPLIVARRACNAVGDLVMDYMRGRYLRKTYSRLEQMYIDYYEMPATFRATCRTVAQLVILVLLSSIMGWMVGLHHPPCSVGDGSCPRMWCALLWIVAVVGTGHACSTAVAVWGGPLRIQVAASYMHTGRIMAARVFTRPWHILQWMQDPEQWITMISTSQTTVPQPFDPNPILYPSTWVPIRFLQMIAVAKAASTTQKKMSSSRDPIRTIMWSLLVEIALADEWYRVFIGERRVGLGVSVSVLYMIASISLAVNAAKMDFTAGVLLIPTILAVSVSSWMNVAIFWNRLEERKRQATINSFQERRQAALRALRFD